MKFKIVLLGVVFILGMAVTSEAQQSPRVNKTQIQQKKRIKQGIRSGELTRAETKRLARQQRQIQRQKRTAKRDGQVTPRERQRIRKSQKRANRAIIRGKHNRRDRP